MIKAIFWDNDGILVDTEYIYYESNRQIFKRFNIDLTLDVFKDYNFIKGKSIFEFIQELGYDDAYISKLRDERDELFGTLLDEKHDELLMENVAFVLDSLKNKYLMGIVTSTRKRHFNIIHQSTGILDNFKFVLTAENYSNSKPHPEPYLKALEKSGLKKSECIVVEDTERGLEAATAAGLRCIIIPHPLTRECNFKKAYRIIDSISQLDETLQQIE